MLPMSQRLFTVYVLKSDIGKLYVGMTSNLSMRLEQHRNGECYSSRKLCKNPAKLKLRHSWYPLSMKDAAKLEDYLHAQKPSRILELVGRYPRVTLEFRQYWITRADGANYRHLESKDSKYFEYLLDLEL